MVPGRPFAPFALCNASKNSARLTFLAAVCAVVEGATFAAPDTDGTVTAALNDAQRRVCVLGGRADMPRSFGSVYAGSVVRFLGGCRGVPSRVIETGVASWNNTMALTHDGTMLLAVNISIDVDITRPAITVIRVAGGDVVRRVGTHGTGPLQFRCPRQVCVAVDEHVFIADCDNDRVQVLTPTLEFHSFLGADQLVSPVGVCADDTFVGVSEFHRHRISVFARRDGALLHRFGDGQLAGPLGLCFVAKSGTIAVADVLNRRVLVFTVGGTFVRRVGAGVLSRPLSVACSDGGTEIVVADNERRLVAVFDVDGELLRTLGCGNFSCVTVHDGAIYAHTTHGACTVFT
jgi:DNA-binding beta-propeller fold protein YncE